jgi:predicted ATPase
LSRDNASTLPHNDPMLIHKCVLPRERNQTFGPLRPGFEFDIHDGYTVLVGENDIGKSSIIQYVARTCFNNRNFSNERTGFIPAERDYVDNTSETQGGHLANWNGQLSGILNNQNRPTSYASPEINANLLPKFFLTHSDFMEQSGRLNEFLAELEFPKLQIGAQQRLRFNDIEAMFHGSGLRSIFPILAALTDPQLRIVLIDEPERSLEARLQKRLRDLLQREATRLPIIVSTHSHLFLNLQQPSKNLAVSNANGPVTVTPVQDDRDLMDIAFTMLGNSTQDLFLPGNFLVVEGAFDQAICEKIARILDFSARQVKVLSSGGVNNGERLHAVENNLKNLIDAYSPYKERVCALINAPHDNNETSVNEIEPVLGNRCFVLPEDSMEKYIPQGIYAKAGLNRDEVLADFESLKSQPRKRDSKKREVSVKLAQAISTDDLRELDVIVKALESAKALVAKPEPTL